MNVFKDLFRLIGKCLFWSTGIFLLSSCEKDMEKVPSGFEGFKAPGHFPPVVYQFDDNKVTKAGFELGRELFYEPLLSVNGKVSCASCHHHASGFSDEGHKKSLGHEGREGLRNSPSLANLAWYTSFMWDGGVNHIEIMPLAPITDSLEMGEDIKNVLAKLQATDKYPPMFEKAFGSDEIKDSKPLLLALAQFMGMMVSDNSRYDQYLRGEAELNEEEKRGMELFNVKCASCHHGPLQTDFSFRNNGLDPAFSDQGRGRITLDEGDMGKFKVPSLRNIELSSPYMHDGRFSTLEEVLDHYSGNIKDSPTLDPSLRGGIEISQEEKKAIRAFLSTLTDYEYISNSKFSKPEQK